MGKAHAEQRQIAQAILRDLKDLQKKGLIKKKGSTKGAVYVMK